MSQRAAGSDRKYCLVAKRLGRQNVEQRLQGACVGCLVNGGGHDQATGTLDQPLCNLKGRAVVLAQDEIFRGIVAHADQFAMEAFGP